MNIKEFKELMIGMDTIDIDDMTELSIFVDKSGDINEY